MLKFVCSFPMGKKCFHPNLAIAKVDDRTSYRFSSDEKNILIVLCVLTEK